MVRRGHPDVADSKYNQPLLRRETEWARHLFLECEQTYRYCAVYGPDHSETPQDHGGSKAG